MTKHQLQIDIETMATTDDAAIIAIGLCVFDLDKILESRSILINPKLAIGHRNPNTMGWWYDQDTQVRERMFSGIHAPWEACELMTNFIHSISHTLEVVWANPPQFDLVILRHMYSKCNRSFPVHYRQERCFRTLKSLAHELNIDYSPAYAGVAKHDAEADAVAQAKATQIILRELRDRG